MDAREVSIEIEGRTYHALYWVEDDTVTVSTGLVTRRAQRGHVAADAVARMLLSGMVEEGLLNTGTP